MPAHGKHRRPRRNHISRGLALVGTGGAALSLPLIAPATAGAATAAPAPEIAAKAFTAPAAPVAAKAPAAPEATRTYTVVSGDSLSRSPTRREFREAGRAFTEPTRAPWVTIRHSSTRVWN